MLISYGGTTPGIITNMRIGYNDSTSEPWPPLNPNDSWGGAVTNITAGPGMQLVGLGQVGFGAPDGSPAQGAIGFLWAPRRLIEAGLPLNSAQVVSCAAPNGRGEPPVCVPGQPCCVAQQQCKRHASLCNGTQTASYRCVFVGRNQTFDDLYA